MPEKTERQNNVCKSQPPTKVVGLCLSRNAQTALVLSLDSCDFHSEETLHRSVAPFQPVTRRVVFKKFPTLSNNCIFLSKNICSSIIAAA